MPGAGGFDLAPDGKRVVMFVPLAAKDASQRENTVAVVLNFSMSSAGGAHRQMKNVLAPLSFPCVSPEQGNV